MARAVSQAVVLAPHPDDAILSAWHDVRGGARVCTVCTGVPAAGTLGSFDSLFGVDDSAKLVAVRLEEDAAALRVAGADPPLSLGFLDEQYRSEPIPRDGLRAEIEGLIGEATHLVAPAGIGAHADHLAVRDVALEIARDHECDITLYADLPYAVRFGWPSWVTGCPPRPFLVPDAPWEADLPTDVALRPYPIVLDPIEAELKVRALECYETQFAALNAGPLDRLRHPEIIGFEVRFAVTFS